MAEFVPPSRYQDADFELRPYQAGDGALLLEAVEASRADLMTWIPWVASFDTLEDAEAICRRYRAEFDDLEVFRMMALQDGRMIGGPAFLRRGLPIEWNIGEVGMWVRSDLAGKGCATRLLRLMLNWGFTEWGYERLCWKCDTRNIGSVRVAQKCGLQLEGTFRQDFVHEDGSRSDTHVFAILREEWEACQN